MDLLLNLEAVTSHHNLKGLRHLFDVVESNVRGLKALGVPPDTYGGLLSSILMKLPAGSCVDWDLDAMMKVIEREVEARERSVRNQPPPPPRKFQGCGPQTALSLMSGASPQANCVYCDQPHSSNSCRTITSAEARKKAHRTAGCCFVCLRKGHIIKNCRSTTCQGRHHISICSSSSTPGSGRDSTATGTSDGGNQGVVGGAYHGTPTAAMYVNLHTPILLQTAKAMVCDTSHPEPTSTMKVRAILDPGSQRSYVTS